MASRVFLPRVCSIRASTVPSRVTIRTFQSSSRLMDTAAASAPVRKPVGAFRGGLFGFLAGSTLAGASVYYYILEEYKVSNEMLTEDIYALQAATQRIHTYVSDLESKVDLMQKKK